MMVIMKKIGFEQQFATIYRCLTKKTTVFIYRSTCLVHFSMLGQSEAQTKLRLILVSQKFAKAPLHRGSPPSCSNCTPQKKLVEALPRAIAPTSLEREEMNPVESNFGTPPGGLGNPKVMWSRS